VILLEKHNKLFFKRSLRVMLLLVQDVLAHRILAGFAHAKSTIASLPSEAFDLRPSLVNPTLRIGLNQAGDIRN
jgi:hypothetical protein